MKKLTIRNSTVMRKALMTALSLILSVSTLLAQTGSITISTKERALKSLLKEIENQCDFSFVYSSSTIDANQNVSITVNEESVEKTVEKLCNEIGVDFTINGKQIVLSPKKDVSQEEQPEKAAKTKGLVIKGVVFDETKSPILGAAITIKGTTTGTTTDINGAFTITLPANAQTLVVSYVGYQTIERKIDVANKSGVYNFNLQTDTKNIEEVVVTGYQTISRERATGSFAVISPKDIQGKLQTNIMDRMEGMVAGLTQTNRNGDFAIRGTSTISGTRTPLYVVDGVPFEGDIDAINPSDIVNVTVLKDATAASIYGARSANGVIVLTTRSGSAGPTKVSYNGSVKFRGLADRDYDNKMSSAELVEFQSDLFKDFIKNSPSAKDDPRRFGNEVYSLLYAKKEGRISDEDFNKQMNYYSTHDRYDQMLDEFVRRNDITHQHNLSFTGGNDIYKYSLSANFQQNLPYERAQSSERAGFNLKNQFNFFKWMKVDVGLMGSFNNKDYDNGFTGNLNSGKPSYVMLYDDNGNPNPWYFEKTQAEIDRLNALGLEDESYYPMDQLKQKHYTYKSSYLNLNIGANIKIIDGLNFDVRYQTEKTFEFDKQYETKDAYSVRKMINDATVITTKDGVQSIQNYIPKGGQIVENRNDINSYTLRAQLNYNKSFGEKHDLQVLVGAERRKVGSMGSGIYNVGYDDNSLAYKKIDELLLSQQLKGTESIFGTFTYNDRTPSITNTDDRYVSFYGNASYTFDSRLTATASIRMDQSNLFGTDPKYQYKPLWSTGLHYVISENQLPWLNRLVARATYGINGNISKKSGPYMILKHNNRTNYYTNESQADITTPPNSALRWEKTAVTNLALDFRVLNRISGSIEWYNKNTTDLMGNLASDPTLGWSSLLVNYGSMYNRGVELTLESVNIRKKDFKWTSSFIFSYNKNMLTRIENNSTSMSSYITSAQTREGYPMGAMFSIRYAGLDANGIPQAYKADGTVVNDYNKLTKDDLVYEGTSIAPYSASLTNRLNYKGLSLSFMFTYYGGHVLRDVEAGLILDRMPTLNYGSNMDRGYINRWKNPGDEANPNLAPGNGYLKSGFSNSSSLWQAADRHMEKGAYIKLRDLSISYDIPNSISKKALIQNASVSFQVQNLWTWSANKNDLDPEVWSGTTLNPGRGTKYPATYSVGLSLNF